MLLWGYWGSGSTVYNQLPQNPQIQPIDHILLLTLLLDKHQHINGIITDLIHHADIAIVEDIGLWDGVSFIGQYVAEGSMLAVILAGLDLNENLRQTLIIIDQVVYLATAAVIVIKQLVTVGNQLAVHHALIDRTPVDRAHIIQGGPDVISVEDIGQDAHII